MYMQPQTMNTVYPHPTSPSRMLTARAANAATRMVSSPNAQHIPGRQLLSDGLVADVNSGLRRTTVAASNQQPTQTAVKRVDNLRRQNTFSQSPQLYPRQTAHIPTPQLQFQNGQSALTTAQNLAAFALPQPLPTAPSLAAFAPTQQQPNGTPTGNGVPQPPRLTVATGVAALKTAMLSPTASIGSTPGHGATTSRPSAIPRTMKNLNCTHIPPPTMSPVSTPLLNANAPQTAPLMPTTPLQRQINGISSAQTGPVIGVTGVTGSCSTNGQVSGQNGITGQIGNGQLSLGNAKPVLLQTNTNGAARSTSPFPTTTLSTLKPAILRSNTFSPAGSQHLEFDPRGTLDGVSQIVISNRRLKVEGIIGKGSFGSVWAAKAEDGSEVAIKEILGDSSATYEKAAVEMQIVNRIHREIGDSAELRIPKCLYWDTKRQMEDEKWRIRMVMNRIPGSPLSSWMLKYLGDPSFNFHKATIMALTLLKQFAPTMHSIERFVYHRDVNSHNILVSEDSNSFNFYMIDFGLAVDSATWRGSDTTRRTTNYRNAAPSTAANHQSPPDPRRYHVRPACDQSWKTLDIGGDCKYWPTASWKQFMWGWKSLSEDDVHHYRHRLDFHSLGITCYELIFYQAPTIPDDGMPPEMRQLVDDLREVWAQYWTQSTHYWGQLFGTFTGKKDWKALRDLMKDSVTNAFQSNLQKLRHSTKALLKTTFPPKWAHLVPLFSVMLDLIDTIGQLSWKNVEEIVSEGWDCDSVKNHLAMKSDLSSQRVHRRARSIDTDSYTGRVADRDGSPRIAPSEKTERRVSASPRSQSEIPDNPPEDLAQEVRGPEVLVHDEVRGELEIAA